MVWWLLLLPLSAAILCRPGHQFWDETLEKCINCSTCPKVGHIVVRPCQVHQDTQCGPLSDLDIDWSFLGRPRSTKSASSLHHQHLSKKYTGGNRRRSGVESSQDIKTFPNHRNRNPHPVFVSSEEIEVRSHKKSHHKKLSSEETFSDYIDETPKKHHNHHHSHKKFITSETRSSNPRKTHSNNHNKTTNHHQHHRFEWTSSDAVDISDAPDSPGSSQLHNESGHRWSFSETASSFEHHTSSSTKSNSTKKLSHHHSHHSQFHKKQMDTPETRKHHRKKQKLQSLQEEVDNILVQRPESASQLKETETVDNSSFIGEVKNDVQGQQRVLPKHLHKIGSPPSVSSAPFSATEELVWDWQAIALALAVFACLLFFVVACVYTVHHARQWRRLKDNFEDFEAG